MADRDVEFDAFFSQHWAPTVRMLTVATGDAAIAADAAQDAFVRAYARWGRIRRYDAPVAWVRKVALNRCRDLHRSDQRRRHREERTAMLDGTGGSWEGPPVGLDLDHDGDLTQALSGLPDRQRTAVALHYVADMSVRDVADAMGISEGAVKFNLHQGRARLAEVLGKDRAER